MKAKRLLESKGLHYTEINIEEKDPSFAQELFTKTGFRTVPQIFIGENCIGGCDQLYALEAAGKLDSLISSP